MEFRLENFEVSGLGYVHHPGEELAKRDYQLKIIADEGLAFHSSWKEGVPDAKCRHVSWPDDICLECDAPLVGMHMIFEVVLKSGSSGESVTALVSGELLASMWDGLIDAIIGLPHTRDVVTHREPDSPFMTATTIVGVPMYAVAEAKHGLSLDDHPIMLFIKISIKAVPLDSLDASAPPTPHHTGAEQNEQLADTLQLSASVQHTDRSADEVQLPQTAASDKTALHRAEGGEDPAREEQKEAIEEEEEEVEEGPPGPEIVDIVGAVESIRPFAPPPPPPPPPPAPAGHVPSLPVVMGLGDGQVAEANAAAVTASSSAAAPPPPSPPVVLPQRAPAVSQPAPPPPPPSAPAPGTPSVSSKQPPPPPPDQPLALESTTAAAVPPAAPAPAGPDVLHLEAALSRAHAPSGRHGKSRASFTFVPSETEDLQGIPLVPAATVVSAPPPPPPPAVSQTVSAKAVSSDGPVDQATKNERGAGTSEQAPATATEQGLRDVAASQHFSAPQSVEPSQRIVSAEGNDGGDGGSESEPLVVDPSCTDITLLQCMLRQVLGEHAATRAQLQAAEARAGELQQSLAMKEVEVRKLNKERVVAERAATAGREQLRKELQAKLSAAEAALQEREAALQDLTKQLAAQVAQLEEARAAQPPPVPAPATSVNRSPSLERGAVSRASITAASPSARIAHRRESLTAASVVQAAPSFPALLEESSGDADFGHVSEANAAPQQQPQQRSIAQPDQQGSDVKCSASVPMRHPSSTATLMFGQQTDTGTAGTEDGDDAVEQVRPFEDSDLAPEPELELLQSSSVAGVKRAKSKSVSERSQSLSQLDSSQRHLQEMLRAEMEKKTPKQRLRHLDGSEVELSERTPRGTPQPLQQRELGEEEEEHELSALEEARPSLPLSLASVSAPGDGGPARRSHRERESAVELAQAAAQAAAANLAEDRRQRLLSQRGRRSDSPAGSPALDSLLMPIVRSNSGAVAQLSMFLSATRGDRPPSVNSTTSSKSPMPGGRRMLGSLFRRQSRIDITDGGSVTGMSAADDPAGGGSAVDEEEIASSIRDLNATFRFSPLPVSRQVSSLAEGSPQPSPADRVMQRMLDRRRSQMVDEARAPAGSASGGSAAAAPATLSPEKETAVAQNPFDAIPALLEPGEMAAAQRALSPSATGEAPVTATQQPRASVAFSAATLPSNPAERKMTLQPRYGRARFSRTQSMAGAREGVGCDAEARESAQEEGPGGSAESKAGSDSEGRKQDTSHSGSGQKVAAEATVVKEPPLPPHLLRKRLVHAHIPRTEFGHRGKGLHVHIPDWERGRDQDSDADAELAEIDAAAQLDRQSDSSAYLGGSGTGSATKAHGGPYYLYFPLELTQRDYLRRLFEILGDAARGPLLQLFHTTEHTIGSAFSTVAGGDAAAAGHGGLFSSPAAAHYPAHRHSTGGHLPIPTPGTVHSADHHLSFPWQEAARCDAVGLLAFLLDARFNFKLRPYVCAKGTSIPSNDAYSALLRAAEQLTEAHATSVSAICAGNVVYVPQESGRLEEVPHLFAAAKAVATTLSAAADRCRHSNAHSVGASLLEPVEPLAQFLQRLADLENQLTEHMQFKDRRVQAAGWAWDSPSDDPPHHRTQSGTPQSPLVSRPHSRAASDMVSDHGTRPASGASNSIAPAAPRRFSAVAPREADGSAAGARRASVSRNATVSPNSMFCAGDQGLGQGEGVLTHLYRRSEATAAHLLVAVLPSNIAVIELMVCFSEIHELLRVYQEHHRRSGHREESQFLREFAEALEQQLDTDLSSIGAFKTSQQQQLQAPGGGYAASVVSSQSTSTVGAYFSPQKNRSGQSRSQGSPEQPVSTPLSRLQLTQGIAASGADSAKKAHTPHSGPKRPGYAGIDTEVLDQIYIELDEMAAAGAAKESKSGSGSDNTAAVAGSSNNSAAAKPLTSFGKALTNAVPVLRSAAPATQSQKDLKVAAEREAWSSLTAPVDSAAQVKETVVRIQHRVQSGRYLLQHMRELVAASEELIAQLDDSRTALVAQRNRDYADVDREITKDQLRRSLNQEEKIGAVIKELTNLSTQVKHKLAPLHLTHNEELCALLSSRGLMGELANKLLSVSLTTVNAGHREHIAMCVATLLIRSKSVALVSSVYKNWPQLTITYAVINTESVPAEPLDRFSTPVSLANAGPSSPVPAPTPIMGRSLASGYKPPYSLDFSSPTPQRGKGSAALLSPRNGGAGPSSASVSSARAQPQQQQVVQVEYVTVPADSADVYGSLDFGSTRSLRLLGFTLTQMRHSKCFDLRELLAAGFPLSEVKNLKSTLSVNISAKDLRLAGYSAHECLNVGFDVASLRAGGFDDYSLVRSGLFNSAQLRAVGCDIQRIALMALFEALDGKHWRHKENWASATAPIGHWYGVHLDGAGHVYKIDLRHNGLKGTLPPALSLLTSLQQLDLYGNLITGDIPAEYAELTALRDLYLGSNPVTIDRAALHALLPHCKLRL